MPRSKTQSPSESTMEAREARRRVVKACQRCRLKKCKCDGSTPCTRCKSDNAICAYGKHKKSDKTVFRKGYVQMLERQHTQLIAGLQELYRRTRNGEHWTGLCPDFNRYGQPLTHKILEALGVLQQDEWDDSERADGNLWRTFEQSFEQQADDLASMYPSAAASPSAQAAFSPVSVTQGAFSNSVIMAKRRSKYQGDPSNVVDQTIRMPVSLTTSFPQSGGNNDFPYTTALAESTFSIPATTMSLDTNNDMDYATQGRMLTRDVDWTFDTDDMFDNAVGQAMSLHVGAS